MIRRPPRSTLSSSSAASDVYKRQVSTQSTGNNRRSEMEAARTFFDACEAGKGWEVCKDLATDGPFTVQANDALPGPPITECTTISAYCDWMKGVCDNFGDKATVDIHSASFDDEANMALFFATFGGFSHYVYAIKMEGGKVSALTKIWNDTHAGNILAAAPPAE
eukprot:TRINITY_DN10991_c0_g1_i2.p2 TRINITY_DN10991_c0_g1~~TRINITY_DN10991_c0_g1_i2.p2  ORF type:complete len:165 (+),score=49.94 TRINITY_DN10991_c0_g1_i2:103-597(+)